MSRSDTGTFLLRHGRYNDGSGRLTPDGVRDAESALHHLLALGLGEKALVLSSDAKRALETADIIARGLGGVLLSSKDLNNFGNAPRALVLRDDPTFEGLLDDILTSSGANVPGDHDGLVVVTHGPLIDHVSQGSGISGGLDDRVPHGQLFEFVDGSAVMLQSSVH